MKQDGSSRSFLLVSASPVVGFAFISSALLCSPALLLAKFFPHPKIFSQPRALRSIKIFDFGCGLAALCCKGFALGAETALCG